MEWALLQDVAIAVGLGLLVGLERERIDTDLGGIRTFPLISLSGVLLAHLSTELASGWIFASGLVTVSAILGLATVLRHRAEPETGGATTTQMAAIAVFAVGGLVAAQHTVAALAVTGAVASLLFYKEPLHRFTDAIGAREFRALIRLVIIGLIILPVLPNETYGPYDVLNPFQIWLMVVVIVGISMAAYVCHRLLGEQVGAVLGGLLGGLISSTATTVSYSRNASKDSGAAQLAPLVVYLASTVVFVRVIVEIFAVARSQFFPLALPMMVMLIGMSAVSVLLYFWKRPEGVGRQDLQPPSNLRAAMVFGLLYAGVLLMVAALKENFGNQVLYGAAAVSGLTDMSAITLSTAHLVSKEQITPDTGWRLILVGGLANLVFKGGVVAFLGPRAMFLRVAVLFAITLAGGAALIALWPDEWVMGWFEGVDIEGGEKTPET